MSPFGIEEWHDAFAEHLQLSELVGERPEEDAVRARTLVGKQLRRAFLRGRLSVGASTSASIESARPRSSVT
jgi:hypothetical protein